MQHQPGRAVTPVVTLEASAVSSTRSRLGFSFLPIVAGGIATLVMSTLIPVVIGVTVTAVLLILQSKSIRHQWQWRQPTLDLPSTQLALGQEVEWTYRRASRKPIDVANANVSLALTCTEEATYTQVKRGADGNDSRDRITQREVVARIEAPGRVVATPDGLEATGIIVVPTTVGAPTMTLRNNEISWRFAATLFGPDLPGGDESFDEITVVPVLSVASAPPPPPSIQDSVQS